MSSKFQAKISGKKVEWKEANSTDWIFERRPGGWVIGTRAVAGKPERIRFYYAKLKNQFWAKIHGEDYFGEKNSVSREGAADSSASDFTAQFPGKVRKIMVAEGAKVEVGASLLMIEAMKMEFAVKATNAGVVKKINVTEGQQLTPGQKLLDFEDAKSEGKKK